MALTFPDVPRMELGRLLVQLIDRVQDVLTAQGRLRGLLAASRLIGALGVLGPGGQTGRKGTRLRWTIPLS